MSRFGRNFVFLMIAMALSNLWDSVYRRWWLNRTDHDINEMKIIPSFVTELIPNR